MEVEYDNLVKKVVEMYSFFPPVKEQVHNLNNNVKKRKKKKSKSNSTKNKKKDISKNGNNLKE